jgi:GT2 family glycosyltransferase
MNDRPLPRVSIIIVNYNGYRWLEKFMDDFICTLYPDFEIIVVDNASTDQSVRYLKEELRDVRVVELSENKGYGEAANLGARSATGAILTFINNDIEVKSDWLVNAVSKLGSDSGAAVVQCKILKYNNRERIDCLGLSVDRYNLVHMIGRHEIDQGQYDNMQEIGACSGGAMVIWKRIFHDIGDFDPTYFMYYEDVDLSWRIRMKGFRILPAPGSVVYHVGSATARILDSSDETSLTPFFAFHTTKNYIYCWLKNSSTRVLCFNWPVIVLIVLAKISFELVNGKTSVAFSQIRGIVWNLKNIGLIIKHRQEIKKMKKVGLKDIQLKNETNGHSHLRTWIRYGMRKVKHGSSSK